MAAAPAKREEAPALPELRPPPADPTEAIWGKVDTETGVELVANAEPGSDYRWLNAGDFAPDGRQMQAARQRLRDRGFEPISGPLYQGPVRKEYVPGQSVEIWRRPQELADEEWRADLARSCLDARWVQIYWRHHCAPGAPAAVRGLPEALEYATLVFHGLQSDTKRLNPRREHIIALARRAPVHPRGAGPDPMREEFAQLKV